MKTEAYIEISPKLFSLDEVKMACYTLLGQVNGEVIMDTDTGSDKISVKLKSEKYKSSDELMTVFNNELIASSVKKKFLEKNKELRDYIARTAFIPTTYNFDIISKLIEEKKAAKNNRDNPIEGNIPKIIKVTMEGDRILIEMKDIDFILADILELCFALSDVAVSEIQPEDYGKKVYIKPKSSEISLATLRIELEKAAAKYLRTAL